MNFDVTVIGAGFGGSLMAIVLHRLGYKVALIERGSHPRFAIGESSTPIADMILRDLATNYDLPWLHPFSRYGSWQRHHPQVVCGLKRGFSYFKHYRGKAFSADWHHSHELLVAASADDHRSDTNWLRSDFDAHLVARAIELGVAYRDRTEIIRMHREKNVWEIAARRGNANLRFSSSWIVDATGSGSLLSDQLGISSSSQSFRTNTYALFSHFRNVEPWSDWLRRTKIEQADYPFNPDHSALHHLLDEGWMWMLRFNNGLASCGIVFNGNRNRIKPEKSSTEQWERTLAAYPSLQNLFRIAGVAETPGTVITSKRLQRRTERGVGDGWIALPHTIGFIDPLHSTGIAHTLSGVERIGHFFKKYGDNQAQLEYHLKQYEQAVFDELAFIDLLVSGCLDTTHHMELFTLYSMLYFTAAITYEQLRLRGRFQIEHHWFLSSNHPSIPDFVRARHKELQQLLTMETLGEKDIAAFRERIRQDIEPYNIAGLLRPEVSNMYRHSVAEL